MKPLEPFGILPHPGSRPGRGSVRGAEKSSNGSGLNGNGHNRPENRPRPARRLEVELVCQAETAPHDPFWDAPRLKPAFVAQFMGQVMTDATPAGSVSAYETKPVAAALLLDAQL